MESPITLLFFFIITFLLSSLITRAVINVAPKVGFVCHPNHRSSHSEPMPFGGGLGFVIPLLIVSTVLLGLGYMPLKLWIVVLVCGGAIVGVGLWDDVFDSSVFVRLLVQVFCVVIGVWLVRDALGDKAGYLASNMGLLGFLLSVVVLIWWLNLFNFMDGIDGLAGAQAVYMALGAVLMLQLNGLVATDEILLETRSIELLLAFLSVSVLGFLAYNWAPAKVFMGDAGSTFLGFVLGMIALFSIIVGALPLSVWLILGAVFLVDATFTLVRRILSGKRWYLAHKSHAYQRALTIVSHIDKNYENRIIRNLSFAGEKHTHKRVCLIILVLNIFLLLPLATLAVIFPDLGMAFVFVAWVPLIWIVFRLDAGKERTMSDIQFPSWPQYAADEKDAVRNVLDSGKVNYWTGIEGRQFERDFATYCGVSHGIALANGSVALELALKVLDIGPGDEVIVPPRTFIATVSSVVLCGATPIFADVDRNSQNITADSISKHISPNTKAIILVHLAGWPCDMEPIMKLASEHNIRIIEDCAQAHGARYKGRSIGSFGDVAAFSFCQDKIMTTGGEGGMLLLNNHDLWKKAWAYKDHGKSYDAIYQSEQTSDEVFRWVHESFGTNWRMTEMQSAIGGVQLKKLDNWVKQRQFNAQVLVERFSDIASLRTPMPSDDCYHSYYKFYTFIRPELLKEGWTRNKIIHRLNAGGAPCFYGSCSEVYKEKAFNKTGLQPSGALTVAQELGETSLMFPVHPTMSKLDMHAIADVVDKVIGEAAS